MTKGRNPRVKPHDYQPSKAELEEFFHVPATPQALAKTLLTQVHVVEDPNA